MGRVGREKAIQAIKDKFMNCSYTVQTGDYPRFCLTGQLGFFIMKSLCWRPLGQGWNTRGSTLWLDATELFNLNSETHYHRQIWNMVQLPLLRLSSCNTCFMLYYAVQGPFWSWSMCWWKFIFISIEFRHGWISISIYIFYLCVSCWLNFANYDIRKVIRIRGGGGIVTAWNM